MRCVQGRSLISALSAAACSVSLYAGPPYVQVGPPDRVSATNFLVTQGSSIQLRDMNNDSVVSDTDVALQVYDQLIAVYGPDLQVGDLDQDGVVSSEDLIEAIARVLLSTFGKVTPDEQPVGPGDVLTVVDGIMNASPTADVNLDGAADALDIAVPITNIELDLFPLEHGIRGIALGLYDYIVVIQAEGREALMADEPVAADEHAVIVSGSWPSNPPRWWPPNHRRSVSETIKPEYPKLPPWSLQTVDPAWPPLPSEHAHSISRRWPANHDLWISQTWEGFDHDLDLSVVPGQWPSPTLPQHLSGLSKQQWPPNHAAQFSRTWPASHDQADSRGWWPMHTWIDSSQRRHPPMHSKWITSWDHYFEQSKLVFPPNHTRLISRSWPLSHQAGLSAHYPPNHISHLSYTWPGPRPLWPPNHTQEFSDRWPSPAPPAGWPLFPPDHTWFTTFTQIQPPGIIPRIPWAAEP
jgi:hypothetical protein